MSSTSVSQHEVDEDERKAALERLTDDENEQIATWAQQALDNYDELEDSS